MSMRDPVVIDDFCTGETVLSGRDFRVDHPFRTTRRLFGPTVLDTEGEAHSRRKRSWMSPFRRREMEGAVEDIVVHAVKAGFEHAEALGDLSAICIWIPNRIILDMLGRPNIDPEKHYRMIRLAANMLEANSSVSEINEIRDYLRDPAFHGTAVFSDLDGETRTREIAVLLVAGVETTIVALEILLCHWAANAQGFKALMRENGAEKAITHVLSADPPFGLAMRYIQKEVKLGACPYPAGTILNVDIAAMATAEPEFEKILFGRGRRQCPGKPLALRELVLVAERLGELSPGDYDIQIDLHDLRPKTFRHPGAIRMRVR